MEGDAGTSRLIPDPETDTADGAQDAPDEASLGAPDTPPQEQPPAEPRRPSRLGTGWVATICVVLLLLGGGGITAGYLALRANARAAEVARSDDAALQAAKECVAATQAPDTAAMTAAQSKILECSTGEFGVQAGLFSSVLAEAYQAADATVAVDDQRVGYRLRATMAFDEGQYRISSLDQVNS